MIGGLLLAARLTGRQSFSYLTLQQGDCYMSERDMSNLEDLGPGASMASIDDGRASLSGEDSEAALDDRGTDQSEAAQILKAIRDTAFDSRDERLALALER
jgi:hypothetical protein